MAEFASWRSYWTFANAVQTRYRFIAEAEVTDFLNVVRETSKHRIDVAPAGWHFWRAQVGCNWSPIHAYGEVIDHDPVPYDAVRMRPLADRAVEGRANPRGIPVLYLSNKMDTAMSEVRPWIGAYLSVSEFKTKRDLRIVDCSRNHNASPDSYIHFYEPEAEMREQTVWTCIDRAFAEPARRDDNVADYIPTQILAEVFRANGCDGVAYKSNFGEDGYTVALFDIHAADPISFAVHRVEGATFRFKNMARTET